jgi:predicted dehydrogenase
VKQLSQGISTGKAAVADVPAPVARSGQILVRVMASLISAGTERSVVEFAEKSLLQKAMSRPDLVRQVIEKSKREGWISTIEAARHRLDSEMVLGYSNSGVTIAVGDDVTGFKVGDSVACAGGGYASHSEIVRVPRNLAAVIPTGPGLREVPFEEAAFATIAAIGLQGVRLADLQLGETVAVIGLGLVGQVIVQLARANGCSVVGMDPSKDRCSIAEQMGCDATAQSAEEMQTIAAKASNGRGVDAVLIAAATESNEPVSLAADIARDRARVIAVGAVGLSLPRKPYYMKELDFRVSRSYGPGRYDPEYEEKGRDYPVGFVRWTEGRNLGAILQLLASHRLNFAPLISHRFPIDEAAKGYDLISGKTGEPYLGVLITYASQPVAASRIELTIAKHNASASSTDVRLGLIGAGNFATAVLLPAMKATGRIEFGGICAAGGTSARAAGSRYGFRYCASDENHLLKDPTIDTIAVCTRHSTHAQLVVAALDAGKHVFCEKPLAMNEDQLLRVFQAWQSQEHKCLLTVGYNRRFAPLAIRLKTFVSDVREPFVMHYRVNAGLIPPEHWIHDREEGGGRVLGEICHFVDFLSFVCGQQVASVSASSLPNSGKYSDDNIVATLTFQDGSIGTITYVSNGDRSYSKERVEVFAQGRIAILDDFKELRAVRDGRSRTYKTRLRVDKGHRGEWVSFAEAIRAGGPNPIDIGSLMNSTLATFSLARACASGSVIDVDTDRFLAQPSDPNSADGEFEEA